jgi:hypothetical protein
MSIDRLFHFMGTMGMVLLTFGCATTTSLPLEKHRVSATVVYADSDAINLAAKARGYAGQRVNGFYDPSRNEIWCPNDESVESLRTCGHELRHLIKGQFH